MQKINMEMAQVLEDIQAELKKYFHPEALDKMTTVEAVRHLVRAAQRVKEPSEIFKPVSVVSGRPE